LTLDPRWSPVACPWVGMSRSRSRASIGQLDPITHLDGYARGPAILLECGAADTHVPPDGALRFQAAMRQVYPQLEQQVRVTVHPGVGHIDGARSPTLAQNCMGWLLAAPASPQPNKA
jgi:hypothetical protein